MENHGFTISKAIIRLLAIFFWAKRIHVIHKLKEWDMSVEVTHIEFRDINGNVTDNPHDSVYANVYVSVSADHGQPVNVATFHVTNPANPNGAPQVELDHFIINPTDGPALFGEHLRVDGCTQVDVWDIDENGNPHVIAANYNYDLATPEACSPAPPIDVFNPTPGDGGSPAVPLTTAAIDTALAVAPPTVAQDGPPATEAPIPAPVPVATYTALVAAPAPTTPELAMTGGYSVGPLAGLGLALAAIGAIVVRKTHRFTVSP